MYRWLVVHHRIGSGGAAGAQALISADPGALVYGSCQMIREPAQQHFSRDKQHNKAAQWTLMGFMLSNKKKGNFYIAVTNANVFFLLPSLLVANLLPLYSWSKIYVCRDFLTLVEISNLDYITAFNWEFPSRAQPQNCPITTSVQNKPSRLH